MSNETKALAIVPKSIDEFSDLAERFSKSSLLPKGMQGKAADVLVTIMAGHEMGLAPMASLRAIHVIEGKPVLSADGMIALVLGSGKATYFERVEESDKAVTYETHRVGAKTPRRCTWTIEMAKAAGLHLKDNWRAYPRAMLASRAKAELARDVFPDVLAGTYTMEEIEREDAPRETRAQAIERSDYKHRDEHIADAEIVEHPLNPALDAALDAIAAAETVVQLKTETAQSLSDMKLTGPAKSVAGIAYKSRLAELTAQEAAERAAANEIAVDAAIANAELAQPTNQVEQRPHPITGSTNLKKLNPAMRDGGSTEPAA